MSLILAPQERRQSCRGLESRVSVTHFISAHSAPNINIEFRGIDAAEKVVVRKQLRRSQVLEFFKALPPCLVGMEACATAHLLACELTKLGHQVRLMPAKDVIAYKTDSDFKILATRGAVSSSAVRYRSCCT